MKVRFGRTQEKRIKEKDDEDKNEEEIKGMMKINKKNGGRK